MDSRVARSATVFLAALVLSIAAPAETRATQLVNRSFEQGTLNGWDYFGDASAQTAGSGVSPTHGDHAALVAYVSEGGSGGRHATATGGGNLLEFLGLPTSELLAMRQWSAAHQEIGPCYGTLFETCGPFEHAGPSGAIRQSVDLRAGDVVSFDWMRVGDYLDQSYGLFY